MSYHIFNVLMLICSACYYLHPPCTLGQNQRASDLMLNALIYVSIPKNCALLVLLLLAWTAHQTKKHKVLSNVSSNTCQHLQNHCYCARSGNAMLFARISSSFSYRRVPPQHTADRKCDLHLNNVTVTSSHLTVSEAKTLFMDLNKQSFLLVASWSPETRQPPDDPS